MPPIQPAVAPVDPAGRRRRIEGRGRTRCCAVAGGTDGRSHSAHWVGLRVAALTALISAVAAITSANCAYILPVRPGRNAAGMNTDISTSVMPTIGPISSCMALHRRRRGGDMPALDVVHDAFHHDDGVVHHDANGQDDGEQGRQIDGEAECGHGRERRR